MTKSLLSMLAVTALLVLSGTPAHAGDDDYAVMLGYLANTRIDGNAFSGSSGATAVNMAAGDFNQQASLRAFAAGGVVSVASQQQQDNTASGPTVASASIGGNAYNNASGLASINQASGSSNAQLSIVAAALAAQGIREAAEDSLSTAVSASAGEQHPDAALDSGGTRSAAVESSAMRGFQGVMQLNQAAGSGNATSNQLLLSLPPSSQ
ncbi:MAG TPA: hypothetical protein VIL60_09390 [Rhodanobacter sp.]